MINKLLKTVTLQRDEDRRAEQYRTLIRREAKIGGQIFGPIPAGGRREFFCLDEKTWIWHEEWLDTSGNTLTRVTRYDVRPDGILKSQNGQYHAVKADEAKKLLQAAELYQQRVNAELYAYSGS